MTPDDLPGSARRRALNIGDKRELHIDGRRAARPCAHMAHDNICGHLYGGGRWRPWKAAPAYVVTGFFTPDYRPLAEKFAANLCNFAIPHCLYSWPTEEWGKAVMAKPHVVRRAMQEFPDRTIVLMDVDCDVRGPITPALDFPSDIALWLGVGIHRANEPGWRTRAISTSRILIWRQTEAAKRLVGTWCDLTAAELPDCILNEEQTLIWAIERVNSGLSITILDGRYAARNPWHCPADSIIVHKTPSPEVTSRSLLSPEERVRV